jgi:lantibiotic leader peptide-processing serine protease
MLDRRSRTPVVVALTATALVASSLSAGAAPGATEAAGAPDNVRQPAAEATEYVVSYEGDTAAGVAAVEAAGGEVVDVQEEVGLALVQTADADFLGQVRSQDAVTGAALNHSVGTATPGMPHRYVEERPALAPGTQAGTGPSTGRAPRGRGSEPLADQQWDMAMIGATPGEAHRRATGAGVDVGIIDTGVDGTHPDLVDNFDAERSRNFTMDIPAVDGPCEVPTCVDANDVDANGHGTHVAGIVAAARNGYGTAGVAPDATLVNLRAAQDSGYFFVYETVAALVEAGDLGLDVVNMSFYTDPWLFNCASRDDYVSGEVSDEEIAQQATIRRLVLAGVTYASQHGVTLVGSAGNEHVDLAAPTRADATSPDFPPGTERERVVTDNCLILPNGAPEVIRTSAIGPSTTKADFSNYGQDEIVLSAPGGYFRDYFGTPNFQTPGNNVLSPTSLEGAIFREIVDQNGEPISPLALKHCDAEGVCSLYAYFQGTSMAAPHVTGVAALAIQRHGDRIRGGGRSLDPATVREILEATATDHACPPGGVEDYTDEGRDPSWNATCVGTLDDNGFYGEGIVSATGAVRGRR